MRTKRVTKLWIPISHEQDINASKGAPEARPKSVWVILLIGMLALLITTGRIQTLAGTANLYTALYNTSSYRLVPAARGLFYDRNGNKLTINENSYSIWLNKTGLTMEDQANVVEICSRELGLDAAELARRVQEGEGDVLLAWGLSSSEQIRVSEATREYGLKSVADVRRDYLYPEAFAQILGYTGLASATDVSSGYVQTDQVGKYRLEKALEDQLRGTAGKVFDQGGSISETAAIPGNNVFLTIDANWQRSLYKLVANQVDSLGVRGAAAVIVDTTNGDIMAYTSYPSFDPNLFTTGISVSAYQALLGDRRQPLVDKVISQQAAPGSIFKLVTAYSVLENGAIDETTHYYSAGCMPLGDRQFCEFGKFYLGDLDVVRALSRSSNIFFCNALTKLVSEQGYDKFIQAAKALNIGQKTGIILEGELSGVLASPEYKLANFDEPWYLGDTCNTAMGQGMVLVTPLQMAQVVATLYNGGFYFTPNIIDRIEDQNSYVVQKISRNVQRQIPLSEKTRSLILQGMYNAVNTWEGTAYRYLYGAPGNFRAKSGSAEAYEVIDGEVVQGVHGWLIGTFDYAGKTYAYAICVRFGGGGWSVAPIMQRFAGCLYSDFTAAECL